MKKINVTIHCDTCYKNISPYVTCDPARYILKVQSENIARRNEMGAINAVMVYPIIEHDLYFCDIKCMKSYGKG